MTGGRVAYLQLCNILQGQLPVRLQADIVVADPPWYQDENRQFLVAARGLCSIDGQLLLSVPREGTRPGKKSFFRRPRATPLSAAGCRVRIVLQECARDSP